MRGKIGRIGLVICLAVLTSLALSYGLSAGGRTPSHKEKGFGRTPPDLTALAHQNLKSGGYIPLHGAGKIEPDLLKRLLQSKRPVRFLAYLKGEFPAMPVPAGRLEAAAVRAGVIEGLKARALASQEKVLPVLESLSSRGHIQSYSALWLPNAFVVTGDVESARALASHREVKLLRLDHQVRIGDSTPASGRWQPSEIPWGISRIGADRVWEALGVTGEGVVVATIDTGVDWQHPALQTSYRGYDPKGFHKHQGNWFDATGQGALYPVDSQDHGTHVMGIIAGQGGIGVAPGARWIAVRAFNSQGIGYESWIHQAFQWLLAPDGDPSLAPDVVNNSWGEPNSTSEVFRPDLQALRAAGIIPIFSAGNEGPDSGSVSSPASLPEAFAVGATDEDDEVAYFSGRGPSPWGEVKPDVSAPGVRVLSSIPGGSYKEMSGTSMAAPHVTGLTALLLQADPALTITRTEEIIRHSAVPIGEEVPNNDAGWGRIDAYEAVVLASSAGFISGTVRGSDGAPIPQATVTAFPSEGGSPVSTEASGQGNYRLALPAGLYDVTASAFGYNPEMVSKVEVATGTVTALDFSLTPLPTGTLQGYVREEGTESPVPATVEVVGTPITTTTDPSTGFYSLSLPTGSYTLYVRSPVHRTGRAYGVRVEAGQVVTRDFLLAPAPRILLVDGGAWYYGSYIGYFEDALEALDYPYTLIRIKHPDADVPLSSTLMAYDIVVWSSPADSPGYVGAWDALAAYLDAGGRLFLTGQDVAFWDDGGSASFYVPQFRDYIKARFDEDDAGSRSLSGVSGGPFEGLTFSITGGDGADNQKYPDSVLVADPDFAEPLLLYDNGRTGAVGASLCLPYRAIFFSFGFEAIADRDTRIEVMDRVLEWLMASPPAVGVELNTSYPLAIGAAGSMVTHTLRLRNTGRGNDTYSLSITGAEWDVHLSDTTVSLPSCASKTLTVTVEIPPGLGRHVCDVFTVTAVSGLNPAHSDAVTLTAKTPAPVLLVDDDRWYDQQPAYREALELAHIAYDLWDTGDSLPEHLPQASFLSLYPVVVWFTGYDWYEPVSEEGEALLASYLDEGGKLVLSSQDYLYAYPQSRFWSEYLGLITFTNDLSTTVAWGVPGPPLDMPPTFIPLTYPFQNWSDAIVPRRGVDVIWRGEHGLPIGVATTRTIFCAFPLEALPLERRTRALEQSIAHFLSPVNAYLDASPRSVSSGEKVTYRAVLSSSVDSDVDFSMVFTLPQGTAFAGILVSPTVGMAWFDPLHSAVIWQGTLSARAKASLEFQAQVNPDAPAGKLLLAPAEIYAGPDYIPPLRRYARSYVKAPDLSGSRVEVNYPPDVLSCKPFTLNLRLENAGDASLTPVTVTLPVLPWMEACTEAISLPPAWAYSPGGKALTAWGPVEAHRKEDLAFPVSICRYGSDTVPLWIDEGLGEVLWRGTTVYVKPQQVMLPLVLKQ